MSSNNVPRSLERLNKTSRGRRHAKVSLPMMMRKPSLAVVTCTKGHKKNCPMSVLMYRNHVDTCTVWIAQVGLKFHTAKHLRDARYLVSLNILLITLKHSPSLNLPSHTELNCGGDHIRGCRVLLVLPLGHVQAQRNVSQALWSVDVGRPSVARPVLVALASTQSSPCDRPGSARSVGIAMRSRTQHEKCGRIVELEQ